MLRHHYFTKMWVNAILLHTDSRVQQVGMSGCESTLHSTSLHPQFFVVLSSKTIGSEQRMKMTRGSGTVGQGRNCGSA